MTQEKEEEIKERQQQKKNSKLRDLYRSLPSRIYQKKVAQNCPTSDCTYYLS